MEHPGEFDMFDELIEYDGDNDGSGETENIPLTLTKQKPTEKQFKMIKDLFDHGNNKKLGNEALDEIWTQLTQRLNNIGPPEYSKLEWRRKWVVHKYKAKQQMSNREKSLSAAARSKDMADRQINDSLSTNVPPEATADFHRSVLCVLDRMSIKQDVIIANQMKILDILGPSNSFPQTSASNYYDQQSMSLKSVIEGFQQPARPTTGTYQTSARIPIIIIPGTESSLITMFNVTEILQNMTFVSTEDKMRQGCTGENEVLLLRTNESGHTVSYRVIDNPGKLTPQEWSLVVAVFVSGSASQFKGWPWNGNPVEIFSRIGAFHLQYDDMKLDSNVAHWPVTVLHLSRTERQLDRTVITTFWESLDQHIAKI